MIVRWKCKWCQESGCLEVKAPVALDRLDMLVRNLHARGRKARGYACPENHLEVSLVDMTAPVQKLAGTFPVILYFGTEEDRQQFIQVVKHAKPGLRAEKL